MHLLSKILQWALAGANSLTFLTSARSTLWTHWPLFILFNGIGLAGILPWTTVLSIIHIPSVNYFTINRWSIMPPKQLETNLQTQYIIAITLCIVSILSYVLGWASFQIFKIFGPHLCSIYLRIQSQLKMSLWKSIDIKMIQLYQGEGL